MTLIQALIPWTVAVYLSFLLVYGEEVFDAEFNPEGSGGVLDFFGGVFDLVGDLFQFITLGGFNSPLPGILQAVLFLTIGLGWFIVILGLGRGAHVG